MPPFSDRIPDAKIIVFTVLFQGIGYLFFIGIANIFYFLGSISENLTYNTRPVLTQILFIIRLAWIGVAAKQWPPHMILWFRAMLLF